MEGLTLLAGLTAGLTLLGFWESQRLKRHRKRVPIRIHVNGTRGKSSVTRLIAAGLRAGGIRTCAKTTGTLPRFIDPDGNEDPIERTGRPNILEQVTVMQQAAECGAKAIVLECMAVNPLLQAVCELNIVRSTHGVITNARPDHLDVMGPTADDVAKALSGTVPVNGVLFTAERERRHILEAAARDRCSAVMPIEDEHVAAVAWDELSRFAHIEHPDNVALALEVCRQLGVDRETALQGMWSAVPDPGVTVQYDVHEAGQRITFVNCFAANDPQSTDRNWRHAVSQSPNVERRIAVVNCRRDRPERSEQMAELCASWPELDRCIVTGGGTEMFVRRGQRCGLSPLRIVRLEAADAQAIFDEIQFAAGSSALAMGIGNIAQVGMDLVALFRERHLAQPVTISIPIPQLQEAA